MEIRDYDEWFDSANSFVIDCVHCMDREDYKKAAFELHQATEYYYSCSSLVLTQYKPYTHNLQQLGSMAVHQNEVLIDVFPQLNAVVFNYLNKPMLKHVLLGTL